ncbi:unnamed protein product [Pleuronectes platessa]|uniref:Uncharacterized protein n=1 Tax=Pleuronectes platessa TaxID=8262 RepID=A0A9N7YCR5_PLEPL|nr:unnamed protein product [Pleuronectes platessa]
MQMGRVGFEPATSCWGIYHLGHVAPRHTLPGLRSPVCLCPCPCPSVPLILSSSGYFHTTNEPSRRSILHQTCVGSGEIYRGSRTQHRNQDTGRDQQRDRDQDSGRARCFIFGF